MSRQRPHATPPSHLTDEGAATVAREEAITNGKQAGWSLQPAYVALTSPPVAFPPSLVTSPSSSTNVATRIRLLTGHAFTSKRQDVRDGPNQKPNIENCHYHATCADSEIGIVPCVVLRIRQVIEPRLSFPLLSPCTDKIPE